ncbi:TIGR02679 family protein [Blastochloris viridis]|uniref:TIGR02679 family protein n=1 Tax=Blastochloris viridis TaxID=1079 RepID=A0A0H5BE60_BLAVI|nr:TIGR02679 family protein [Blastochloris viridis]ALK09630.1 hypothetical protein BVIR_1856 [Blastochloris viridis]BAS00481.1 hypothetical protein BV133_2887 [Blastochloris viridis]CUU42293.1 hypothetical protein BVIRIDIS_13010 [Blastochloris viridis]
MRSAADARLQRLLGGEHLAALRKRLRRRFERHAFDAAVESFRVDRLTAQEHAALAALLGRPQRYSGSLQIDLRVLDAAFQNAGIAASLRDALEQLDGPITHLANARLARQTLWSDVVAGCDHPGLVELLQTPAGIGLIKRLARQNAATAVELCRRAEAVLQRLPAQGLTRSQLAADVLGDAHALDSGQATAALVLAVLRRLAPQSRDGDDDAQIDAAANGSFERNASVERAREIWARAGILVNELARPVLFLNLPTRGPQNDHRPTGEPSYASLRSLLRARPAWDVANRTVYVCENPNLVAIAADHWGSDCAPLVCTEGMPAAAQRCLLLQLSEAGARLRYHGDFDWPGLHIGNQLMREHRAEPWRFSAADYAAAAAKISRFGQPLQGKPVTAHWDGALTTAMQQYRVAIPEEFLADSLLQDLICKS